MTLQQIKQEIVDEFPMAKIVDKDTKFWDALGTLVKVITFGKNKTFCTQYTTTLAHIIAFPVGNSMTDAQKSDILHHERVHLRQTRRLGCGNFWLGIPLFWFAYILLPFPIGIAYCRYVFEREAYTESLRVAHVNGVTREGLLQTYVPYYVEQLCSGNYAWTWPFKASVTKYFNDRVDEIAPV